MPFVFLSFVGTQIMGTLQPLEGCLQAGLDIGAIELYASQESRCYADEIQAHCAARRHPPVAIHNWQPRQTDVGAIIAGAAADGRDILFNIDGGMNYIIARMVVSLPPTARLVSSYLDTISMVDLASLESTSLPLPPAKPVEELLRQQNVEYEQAEPEFSLLSVIKKCGISLPPLRLENVRIGNVIFDMVWNDRRNKLSFLTNLYGATADGGVFLEKTRNVAAWASGRVDSGQLFDRDCHAFCPSAYAAEHIRHESRFKAHAYWLSPNILNRDRLAFLNDVFNNPESGAFARGKRKVSSHTLVIALGEDETPTLNAILSHGLPHVIVCHTADAHMYQRAQRLRELFAKKYPETDIKTLETDINGTLLSGRLKAEEDAQDLHVNITPGTKGQGAFLALWARRNNALVWSLDKGKLTCLNGKGVPNRTVRACDPLDLLRMRFGAGVTVANCKDEIPLYEALLQLMRACVAENREFTIVQPCEGGGISLKPSTGKMKTVLLPDGTELEFSEAGGEWLEGLVAHVLENMGLDNVSARVRIPWEDELQKRLEKKYKTARFRIDMDVLASYKSVHLLVSCKAMPYTKKWPAAQEAHNMALSINRFAIPVLCHMGCSKPYFLPMERKVVLVIGWRELCQPEKLRSLLETAWERRRTTSLGNKNENRGSR